MPLIEEDAYRLQTAKGFLGLGMWMEANEELENITAEVRHVPEVLESRCDVYKQAKKWELMHAVAKRLHDYDPDHAGYRYAMAGSLCQLGDVEKAKEFLGSAFKIDADLRMAALDDETLEPLWHSL